MKTFFAIIVTFIAIAAQAHDADHSSQRRCVIPTVTEYSQCTRRTHTIPGCSVSCPRGQDAVCESGYLNDEGTAGPWGCSHQVMPSSCRCWSN